MGIANYDIRAGSKVTVQLDVTIQGYVPSNAALNIVSLDENNPGNFRIDNSSGLTITPDGSGNATVTGTITATTVGNGTMPYGDLTPDDANGINKNDYSLEFQDSSSLADHRMQGRWNLSPETGPAFDPDYDAAPNQVVVVSTTVTVKTGRIYTSDDVENMSAVAGADVTAALNALESNKVPFDKVGVANGVCELDGNAQVPFARLPSGGGLNFRGYWDANTNTPDIANAANLADGDLWRVSVAGSTDLGGITTWNINDDAVYDSSQTLNWVRVEDTSSVLSVFGRQGAVLAVAGDYTASKVTNDSGVTGTNVDNALDQLATDLAPLAPHIADVANPHATNVANLADTDIGAPVDDTMLAWNATSAKWKAVNLIPAAYGVKAIDGLELHSITATWQELVFQTPILGPGNTYVSDVPGTGRLKIDYTASGLTVPTNWDGKVKLVIIVGMSVTLPAATQLLEVTAAVNQDTSHPYFDRSAKLVRTSGAQTGGITFDVTVPLPLVIANDQDEIGIMVRGTAASTVDIERCWFDISAGPQQLFSQA